MTERPSMPHIPVPAEVAAAAEMPSDLDSAVLGPYAIPDPARRRRAGVVYWAAAALTAAGIVAGLPLGMWAMVLILAVIAAYHHLAGWHLEIREDAALEIANRATELTVGHASATVGFDGWRSRPVWNVLVFSADDPPSSRGLVRVDATTGKVLEQYLEAVPAAVVGANDPR